MALDASAVVRCRRRVHLDHDPDAVSSPRAQADPALEQRRSDARTHRRELGERMSAGLAEGWVSIPEGSHRERAHATREALEAGAAYIWNAVLPMDAERGRVGDADLLVRAEDGGYRPLIVVRHRVTDPGSGALTGPIDRPHGELAAPDPERRARSHTRDQLRLAHLTRMLGDLGRATARGPALGGVIGLDADVVVWHDLSGPSWPGGRSTLDEYDARFTDRLAVAAAAAERLEALAQPSRITECRHCQWWPTCEPVLANRGDISLVLRGEDANALREAGIATVAALAAMDPAAEPPVPLHGTPFPDAVALARAHRRDLSLVRRVAEVKVPRADIELDVDMESFGESGAYLWGCLLTTPGGDELADLVGEAPGYRAFATWEPVPTVDEARSFAEFWGWLRNLRARCTEHGLSFAAYCYNEQAENRWLYASADRFAGRPGIPPREEITAFVESDSWVDLFAVVSEWFLCAHGKGLKRVAPVAGFRWRDPEAGGENSMRWYRAAVGMDGDAPDPAQRQRLLHYNADDVHATQTLRAWLCSPALAEVPLASEL
ncbi:TM0106 family RecB-like putative nuclease [Pseudonocardia eucalypti]|uniref:TM0106 family RecB-like putative nuclease n=1 Tax=Pseudonocardia eucalypti TaxID=648755 RepID=A0ABP9PDB8_9PSEU